MTGTQALRRNVAWGLAVLAGAFAAVAVAQQPADRTGAHRVPAATDIKPLAGAWIQVEREGKSYVIREYCSSATPRFTLQPNGDGEMDYGQDDERLKVTGLKPGATAGAYTLQLAHSDGTKETVEWTVADAKRGIVRLKGTGTSFFREGLLFVRNDKKAGILVRSEKCDEEEEQ